MGNVTYQLTLIVDSFSYADKANCVFIRGTPPPDTTHVQFVSGDFAAFAGSLKKQPGKDISLVGGG